MSKNMSSTGERYESASRKFDEAYNKYAGEQGLKSATDYAEGQASRQSLMAGNQASANANRGARTAGLSKAQSALMAEQASSDTTGNTYQNVYDSSRASALNNNQASINARGSQVSSAQQEDQNAYNRAWGNLGGAGSMISGLLTSDERLKTFKEVSSRIGNGSKDNDYSLLKVTYRKKGD